MGAQHGEGASADLMRILGDPEGAKKRLTELKAAEDAALVAAREAAVAKEKAQAAQAGLDVREAACLEVEERQKRTEGDLARNADHLRAKEVALAGREKEVENLTANSLKAIEEREKAVDVLRGTLDEREVKLGQWSQQREAELAKREKAANEADAVAERTTALYQGKIAKLRAILTEGP